MSESVSRRHSADVPAELLVRPKPFGQAAKDLIFAPARLGFIADRKIERLGLSSLRAERLAAVLPEIRGRCLDVGANDNLLVRLYRQRAAATDQADGAAQSVGVDVEAWGVTDVVLIESAAELPFEDGSFDTVTIVASLNYVPDRELAVREFRRVTRPGGRLLLTMLSKTVGTLCHTLTLSNIGHRPDKGSGQTFGLDAREVAALVEGAGYRIASRKRFFYGLNSLYVATAV